MNCPGRRFAVAAVAAILATLARPATSPGAAPTLDHFFPQGGRQGTTVTVTVGGKFEKWPVQIWTDSPALKAKPEAASGSFSVEIAKDAAPGAHLVRLYDAQGASACHVFMVGTQREAAEAEPNDEISKAQAVDALPTTLNGRLGKSGDVDSYSVNLEAGQCLTAALQGRRLGAPMDPMLHLFDAAGNPLAFAHDGLGLDPLLVFRAEKAGTYVVRVSAFAHPPAADVKLTGAPADVYRLSLSGASLFRFAMPAGVRRGAKANVRLFPWGSDPAALELATVREVDATGAAPDEEFVLVPAGGDESLRLALDDGPEVAETELCGASAAQAQALPFAATGTIQAAAEEDVYRFSASKGNHVVLTIRAVAVASPMDPVLRVEDEAGKTLASNDDGAGGGSGDAKLEWDAPAGGVYRAVVGDLYRQGGAGCVYRLTARKPTPAITATVDGDEYRITPGKTESIKVKVARSNGHAGGVVAAVTGLPAGVTATAADVPEKGGDVVLTLTAAADAKSAGGPVRVMLLGTDRQHPLALPAYYNLPKEGTGQEMVARSESIWLTVLPAAPEPGAAPKGKSP